MEKVTRTLGKVAITVAEYHSPLQAYNLLCLVPNGDNSKIYISRRNVPAGIQLDNTNYWVKLLDLDKTFSSISSLLNDIKAQLDELDLDTITDLIDSKLAEFGEEFNSKVNEVKSDVTDLQNIIGSSEGSDSTIDTLQKVYNFLNGMEETDNLSDILQATNQSIDANNKIEVTSPVGDNKLVLHVGNDEEKEDSYTDIPAATSTAAGVMTAKDKSNLDLAVICSGDVLSKYVSLDVSASSESVWLGDLVSGSVQVRNNIPYEYNVSIRGNITYKFPENENPITENFTLACGESIIKSASVPCPASQFFAMGAISIIEPFEYAIAKYNPTLRLFKKAFIRCVPFNDNTKNPADIRTNMLKVNTEYITNSSIDSTSYSSGSYKLINPNKETDMSGTYRINTVAGVYPTVPCIYIPTDYDPNADLNVICNGMPVSLILFANKTLQILNSYSDISTHGVSGTYNIYAFGNLLATNPNFNAFEPNGALETLSITLS